MLAQEQRMHSLAFFHILSKRKPSKEASLLTRLFHSIWVADVKLSNPNFRIDGFDKSLQQCPPAEICLKNCSMRQLDIVDNIPGDLENTYDIVNVRLIQGGFDQDPGPALRNLIKMLSKLPQAQLIGIAAKNWIYDRTWRLPSVAGTQSASTLCCHCEARIGSLHYGESSE